MSTAQAAVATNATRHASTAVPTTARRDDARTVTLASARRREMALEERADMPIEIVAIFILVEAMPLMRIQEPRHRRARRLERIAHPHAMHDRHAPVLGTEGKQHRRGNLRRLAQRRRRGEARAV